MVLLLRDSEKAEIFAAISAIESSFTSYHQNVWRFMTDFDSRLSALTNTSPFFSNPFQPQSTIPNQPTFDDLIKKIEITKSDATGSTANVDLVAPTDYLASLEPLSSTKYVPFNGDLNDALCHSFFPTAPHSPLPLPLHRDIHNLLPESESKGSSSPSWNITSSRDQSEKGTSIPILGSPALAFPRCLKIIFTEPILRVFYGRTVIRWPEEPPDVPLTQSTLSQNPILPKSAIFSVLKDLTTLQYVAHIFSGDHLDFVNIVGEDMKTLELWDEIDPASYAKRLAVSRISLPSQFSTTFKFFIRKFSPDGNSLRSEVSSTMIYTPLITKKSRFEQGYFINVSSIQNLHLHHKGVLGVKGCTTVPYTTLQSNNYGAYVKSATPTNLSLVQLLVPFEVCFNSKHGDSQAVGASVLTIDIVLKSELVKWSINGKNSDLDHDCWSKLIPMVSQRRQIVELCCYLELSGNWMFNYVTFVPGQSMLETWSPTGL